MITQSIDLPHLPAQGHTDIGAIVERLLVGARHEATLLVPSYVPDSLEFSRHIWNTVQSRGGRLRMVWQSDLLANDTVRDHAAWLGARKVIPRSTDSVPVRALVIDRTVGIMLDGPERGIVRSPATMKSLCRFADLLWDRATPVAAAEISLPAPRSFTVLKLLSEGLTDEAVARRIGVSVRTVRNDVASTMTDMQANSRFQAGVRAAQLGLI